MNEDLNNIEEVLPYARDNELIIALTEELGNAKNMRAMANSEAGVKLAKELWSKVNNLIDKIRSEYQKCSQQELRAYCGALDVQMEIYNKLVNSGFIVDVSQKELDEAVKDLIEKEG